MTNDIKKAFLSAYDYGMGGLWVLIDARTPEEIETLYPELKVVLERPKWLTDEIWKTIERNSHFDIDAEPSGLLEQLVRERGRSANTGGS